jgi:hypothetical protein
MEYLLLRAEPAELVRIGDGITGLAEKVDLRGGGTLALPGSAIPRDDTGRVDVDRLLQSALMSHAASMSWLFDYDNTKDHDDFWSEIRGDSRVPLGGFSNLWQRMRGESFAALSTGTVAAADIYRKIVAETGRGQRVPVLVGFGAAEALHWMAVEQVADGPEQKRWVYLRNPWGHDEGDGPPPRWPLPEGGGRVGMVVDDFVAILHGAVVPR